MNLKQKLNYLKKQPEGLKYLNSLLMSAFSYLREIKEIDCEFLYLNKVMGNKFEKILKFLDKI